VLKSANKNSRYCYEQALAAAERASDIGWLIVGALVSVLIYNLMY
jgi:hypothetical protein